MSFEPPARTEGYSSYETNGSKFPVRLAGLYALLLAAVAVEEGEWSSCSLPFSRD